MAQQVRFDENVRVTQTTQQTGQGGFGNIFGNNGNGSGGGGGRGGPPPRGPPQKQDFAHEVGNALTAGAGPGGYLAVSGQTSKHIALSGQC